MSLLPPKVTLMTVSTSNTYMKLQNFRKLGKNAKLSKKRTLPISGIWCPLIRDYTVDSTKRPLTNKSQLNQQEVIFLMVFGCDDYINFFLDNNNFFDL